MCDPVDSGVVNNNGYLYFILVVPLHLGLCCLDTPPSDSFHTVGEFEGIYTCVLFKELLARVVCLWGRTTRFCMLSPKGLKPSGLSGGMHNHPRITVVLCKVPHPHKHTTTGLLTLYTTKRSKTHILPCCCG